MSVEEKPTVLRHLVPLAGVAIVTAATVTAPSVAPALFYPLYIALTLIVTALAGRGAGFVTVAASALAISYFSLTGVAFAVSDPVDAAGLIGLIAVDILAVVIVAGYRDWLAVERARCGDIAQRENAIHAITAEVSHRLKNDLAGLAAIAHIGALRAEQPETADALESFGRRIDAQARIYASFDLGRGLEGNVSLQPYLRTLCEDFRLAHLNLRPIALQVDVADIELPAGRVILLGSIVNELLTNATKHAFPEDRPGTIAVTFGPHPTVAARDLLTVTDDGVGFRTDPNSRTGMGSKLLATMAAQLGGGFHLARLDGATVGQVTMLR